MKFPVKLKHRGRVLATIYAKSPTRPYRLYWRVDGKSRMKEFRTYSEAKRKGDELVSDLAKGSKVTALTPKQASDALAAYERLQSLFQATGRRVSLLAGISEYCEATGKLSNCTVGEAIDRYLATVVVVQRKALAEAVAEFIEGRKHLSIAKPGERSKHSPAYERHVAAWLNEFNGTFPAAMISDLTKEHMNTFIAKFKSLSAKSRNDRRCTVRMFLDWCRQKDYLAQTHRLSEAVGLKNEDADMGEIDYYRPAELRALLKAADPKLVPVIALGGLAGLRREEIIRLDWADVWSEPGNIVISARIAKGRKRRLVTMGDSLAEWLRPSRQKEGKIWASNNSALEAGLRAAGKAAGVKARRNGLRHAFITFHMATHKNENLTAAEAGNSPIMIHAHYKGLATAAEAAQWFAVKPSVSEASTNIIPLGLVAEQ